MSCSSDNPIDVISEPRASNMFRSQLISPSMSNTSNNIFSYPSPQAQVSITPQIINTPSPAPTQGSNMGPTTPVALDQLSKVSPASYINISPAPPTPTQLITTAPPPVNQMSVHSNASISQMPLHVTTTTNSSKYSSAKNAAMNYAIIANTPPNLMNQNHLLQQFPGENIATSQTISLPSPSANNQIPLNSPMQNNLLSETDISNETQVNN